MNRSEENQIRIKEAFEAGFSNASKSLGQLTRSKTFYNNFHNGYCALSATLDNIVYQRHNDREKFLFTTDIVGDVKGKSYLFLTDEEYEVLTENISNSNPMIDFKQEFLKELNNILSAAVITGLSNELKKKMHGDVPVLVGKVNSKLEDTLYDDFNRQTAQVYLNSIFFSFENHPDIHPLFVWAITDHE